MKYINKLNIDFDKWENLSELDKIEEFFNSKNICLKLYCCKWEEFVTDPRAKNIHWPNGGKIINTNIVNILGFNDCDHYVYLFLYSNQLFYSKKEDYAIKQGYKIIKY
jgi:hypothetical protein